MHRSRTITEASARSRATRSLTLVDPWTISASVNNKKSGEIVNAASTPLEIAHNFPVQPAGKGPAWSTVAPCSAAMEDVRSELLSSTTKITRFPSVYHRADGTLKATKAINELFEPTYFSGGGGLMATTEEYAKFGAMLASGGIWNGKRLLSPKTVDLMASVFVPDTLPGRDPGKAYGLSVQVISDPVKAGFRVGKGTFGWDGAYGTHFWVDPQEKIVGVMMIQVDNSDRQLDRDFENAVMQAIVE